MPYAARLSAQVLVRDRTLNIVGEIADYVSCTATLRQNDLGAFSLELPADSVSASLVSLEKNTGGGIIIRDTSGQLFSGPIWQRSWKRDPNTGNGIFTVSGQDDNAALTHRLIYPDPSSVVAPIPPSLQENLNAATSAYFSANSGSTESIMRRLVSANADINAELVARRFPGLYQNASGNRGLVQASPKYRYDLLFTELQKLAVLARTDPLDPTQDLGFRVVQVPGNKLEFQVYAIQNRPHARFGFGFGNLASATHDSRGPTMNHGIVGIGGQEDSTGRTIAAKLFTFARPDAYYPSRIEGYVDGGSIDEAVDGAAAIEQVALNALTEGAGQISASITPIDTDRMKFGVDYNLGDFVTVELPYQTFSAPVREVTLNLSVDDGATVDIGIGGQDGAFSSSNPTSVTEIKKIKKIIRRVIKGS